ncbi:MAG: DUF397 domain-containing protein [Actinomycetota bacterium]|nr:DUF397 domain-containing protein [Actinomycetota bacterium]MDQ3578755.1 DUF397 domain-containing protein [Actinomycetota bacterium]
MNTVDLSGAVWRKSSRSSGNGACVEIAVLSGSQVAMRDSKNKQDGTILFFTPANWNAFCEGAAGGGFERS